jgi:hypothetical protein
MKVDLVELKKDIEAELKGLEQRRSTLLKRLELIQGVQDIVEESMSDSGDFRIQKALERMGDAAKESEEGKGGEEEQEEEPPIRLAIGS